MSDMKLLLMELSLRAERTGDPVITPRKLISLYDIGGLVGAKQAIHELKNQSGVTRLPADIPAWVVSLVQNHVNQYRFDANSVDGEVKHLLTFYLMNTKLLLIQRFRQCLMEMGYLGAVIITKSLLTCALAGRQDGDGLVSTLTEMCKDGIVGISTSNPNILIFGNRIPADYQFSTRELNVMELGAKIHSVSAKLCADKIELNRKLMEPDSLNRNIEIATTTSKVTMGEKELETLRDAFLPDRRELERKYMEAKEKAAKDAESMLACAKRANDEDRNDEIEKGGKKKKL